MRVLAFGEILWDIINGVEHLGGAPFNFAAHASQCGDDAHIVSRLGRDPLGERAFQLCKSYKVGDSFIQWDDKHPTGIVDVTLSHGQPDYFIREEVAYDYIQDDVSLAQLKNEQFDVFYFGSLSQRSSVSAGTLQSILSNTRFKHVFYDVNLRKNGYTADIIRRSLSACTIFKLNTDEVRAISKLFTGSVLEVSDFCAFLKSQFPNIRLIVVTASEKGCHIYEDKLLTVPGTLVEVCDAVGAGDAFSAAFMHIYALKGDPLEAAKTANQVGAFVATRTGAIPVYSNEISSLLKLRSSAALRG